MDQNLAFYSHNSISLKTFSRAFVVTSAVLIFAVLFACPRPLLAAGYVVSTLNDDTNDDAFCTLREAILAANDTPANENCGVGSNSDDTITFSVGGTITLGAELPTIAAATMMGALTIDGGETITVSGNDAVRVFYIGIGGDFTLKNLTVSHGSSAFVGSAGGGLLSYDGRVMILNSTFSHNVANYGGGLSTIGGDVTIVNSIFAENQSAGGGGISTGAGVTPGTGTMLILNSTFSSNHATYGAGVYNGAGKITIANTTFADNEAYAGGGFSNAKGGIALVQGSTFSNNQATRGGGIDNDASGNMTIVNSTLSSNIASSTGGGVANYKHSIMSITNSTFFGNSANAGGGVSNNNSTTTVRNTIIANSIDSSNCDGELASDSKNNRATDASCGAKFQVVTLEALHLGALAGVPAYFPLLPGSVAMDKGTNSICAGSPVNHQSQNVTLRPQGGSGRGITRCDIGSYEAPNPCTTQPAMPRLKEPANNVTLHATQPILRWKPTPCAAIYIVDVVDVKNNSITDRSGKLYQLRYRTKRLATGRTYEWFVMACNDFGCATSKGRTFVVKP